MHIFPLLPLRHCLLPFGLMELKSGIYESLIYEALKEKLETLSNKYVFKDSIDSGEAPQLLTNYVKLFSISRSI